MKTEGIHRVLIVVKDLEKAAERYSELLGISFWDPGVDEKFGVRARVSWDGGVELISPIDEQSAAAPFFEEKGEGVIGVAFKVRDVEEAGAEAEAKGFRVTNQIDFGSPGIWKVFKEVFLHQGDTNEVPIILVQSERK